MARLWFMAVLYRRITTSNSLFSKITQNHFWLTNLISQLHYRKRPFWVTCPNNVISQHYLRPRSMDRLWFMVVRYWRIIPRISSIFTSSVRLICFHIISELPNQSFDWSLFSGAQLFDPLLIGLLPYHLPRHCILNSKQSLYTQVPPPACLRLFYVCPSDRKSPSTLGPNEYYLLIILSCNICHKLSRLSSHFNPVLITMLLYRALVPPF